MSSLRDVAERAGVSLATASRVVSGSAGVRPETRAKVEQATRELLYLPRGRRGPVAAIGLIVPELANPIFPVLAQAIEAKATSLGLATILCNAHGSSVREADYVHMLLKHDVDGMIFISSEAADERGDHSHYARLREQGARLVFVNGALASLRAPAVGVDEHAAGALATRHLIELGHRRVGFVAGPRYYKPTRDKGIGRDAALHEADLDGANLVAHGDFSILGARAALRTLLELPEPPTGVICSSDLMAIGVLQEAAALGLRVPDDLSVVGFDGIDACAWTTPPLTTIQQPIGEIAQTAVTALQTLLDEPGRELPQFLFSPRLVVRGSTGRPRATWLGVLPTDVVNAADRGSVSD